MESTMAEDDTRAADERDVDDSWRKAQQRMRELDALAAGFARSMSAAFVQSINGARKFEDVLKSLALRLSDLTLRAALQPVTKGLASGFSQLFAGLFPASNNGVTAAATEVKPFAAGGVIATPTYFPLTQGGIGLAGEAGPEAILPLSRGADGRLGVAAGEGAAPNVTVNISTPDLDSFRRSESYLAGQIARAVARGQRSL
jgi:phage-related minor tail protein